MQIKGVKVKIIKGDIAKLDVDAIVIEKGAVVKGKSKAVCIETSTHNKNKKTDENSLRKVIQDVFKRVDRSKIQTIAFGALGCGSGGFSFIGAAKILTQEVIKYLRMNKTTLKKITFCLPDTESFESFNKNISGYVHHLQETLGYGPYVTVDVIIELKEGIILIERSNPPYGWALPGGFVDYGESLEQAAIREAKEETNVKVVNIRQFHTYSDPSRDPRFQTISTVYIGKGVGKPQFGDDAKGLKIVRYEDLSKLKYAFDHNRIIRDYLKQGKS